MDPAILGSRMDLRLDANEAWSADELLERVAPLRKFGISVLEQPFRMARLTPWPTCGPGWESR